MKKTKISGRLLSALLALVMVVSLLPVAAFAAPQAQQVGDMTVVMNKDGKTDPSMCDVLFDGKAKVAVYGDTAEISLYVVCPIPAFTEQGNKPTVTNVYVDYAGQRYNAVSGKGVMTAKKAQLMFGLEKGKEYPAQELTVKLPKTALQAGKLDLFAHVVPMMDKDVAFDMAMSNLRLEDVGTLAVPASHLYNKKDSGKPCFYWDGVEGAAKYEVWRKVGSNGQFSRYYTTTRTYMNNLSAVPGETYYYKVRAIGSSGNASEFSAVRYITCDCAQPVVTVTAKGNYPYVSWPKVEGAVRYRVYRKINGGYLSSDVVSQNYYKDPVRLGGSTMSYEVEAICGKSTYGNSVRSVEKSLTTPAALPTPTIHLYNNRETGKPCVYWESVEGAVKYEVWREEMWGGQTEYYYTTTRTYMNNLSAAAGRDYYYQVRAIDKNGMASRLSTVRYITCDCAKPTNVKVVMNKDGHPYLTWDKVDGATTYTIDRIIDGGTADYVNHISENTFVDLYTRPGHEYTYYITASNHQSSASVGTFSDPVKIRT